MNEIAFLYPTLVDSPRNGAEIYEENLRQVMGSIPDTRLQKFPIADRKAIPEKAIVVTSSGDALRVLPHALLLRLKGHRLLTVHHHSPWRQQKGIRRLLGAAAEKVLLYSSSKIILPSPYMYAELLYSFSPDKLLLWKIPFEKGTLPEVAPEPGRLAYVGTVEPRKGLTYLLQAMKHVAPSFPSLHLDIIGDTVDADYEEELRRMAEEANLDVTFHGFISAEEKDELLRKAYLFAFPSLLEGFGMVLAEAQRYSLPIVCFDNSAMPYTVKNGVNGLLCPDRDAEAMARAISRLLSDRELRLRLAAGAAAGARTRFSFEDFRRVVTRDTRSLYKQ